MSRGPVYMPPPGTNLAYNGELANYVMSFFPEGYQGWAVDVGASDGVSVNSTYGLEKAAKWTVVSVEANPNWWPMLQKMRTFVERCAVSNFSGEATFHINDDEPESFSSLKKPDMNRNYPAPNKTEPAPKPGKKWSKAQVQVKTLNEILTRWQFPQLDVLCVDTEGTEMDVLEGLDWNRWQPKVVVIECWDPMSPLDLYMEAMYYRKTARNVHNDVWVGRNGPLL